MSKNVIKEIYYSRTLDQMLLAWVDSGRHLVPSATVLQLVQSFKEYYDLEGFDLDTSSLVIKYGRMKKKYYDACKSDKGNNK